MVAHEYVKTPTALADFILEFYEDEDARISSYVNRVRLAFSHRISLMESALQVLASRISAADPRKILERGYALATDADGVVLKTVKGCAPGDKLSVMFADGTLEANVTSVLHCEERSDVAIS